MNELQILLNSEKEILEKQITISEFLLAKGLNPETIIVEYNGKILKKQEWSEIELQDQDQLEVLNFVGGG